ncbi:sel-1-like protein 2 [Heterocephalus glaber]|uniref:Sel-1-like protein 2 n=1 Tax=Heterocephalus glaber TaxID=10181 RepID=G5ALV1_HETGA|nr:sel-1-like protein 2 [Heterocephalus glaber]
MLFAKTTDMGNLKAMEKMADALLFGNFGLQNITAAIQLYEFLAKEGSYKAQNALGFLSSYGIGMEYDQAKMYLEGNAAAPQNNATAFKYFSMAANKGNAIGLHGLGLLYFYGKGVPVLYKGVCELGHWAEKFLTAYFAYNDGDIDSSLVQYALLAEMGYEVAQSNSVFILESKKAKILQKEKMYPMALLLWNRAAVQGNVFARVKIGDYYYYGYGTKKDYQTAATHYSIAAEKYHNAQAMFNLAYMYEHGLGIAKFTTIWKWMKLESTLGPYWDLFVIGLIIAVLIFLLKNRHR